MTFIVQMNVRPVLPVREPSEPGGRGGSESEHKDNAGSRLGSIRNCPVQAVTEEEDSASIPRVRPSVVAFIQRIIRIIDLNVDRVRLD